MVKTVVFDFDGTLVDSKDVFIAAYNKLAKKHHYREIKQEDIEYLRGLSIAERCKFLNFPLYLLPFFAVEFYGLYKASIKNVLLIEGIKDLLDELKSRGYQIAIVSSNSETNIRDFLLRNQISYIQDVICSKNIFGKAKNIKMLMKKYKLKNSEIIYIGDEVRDITASQKSNIKVIWVSWGYDVIDMARKQCPDYIVNTPKEILNVLSEY